MLSSLKWAHTPFLAREGKSRLELELELGSEIRVLGEILLIIMKHRHN